MQFKRRRNSSMPEINLVPMLDVLMTVLTFFILVSMTLTTQQGVDLQLPSQEQDTSAQEQPDPLLIELQPDRLVVNAQPIAPPDLTAVVEGYLQENPKGAVVLEANPQVPYEQVVQLLGELKDVGGDQVSLAIE